MCFTSASGMSTNRITYSSIMKKFSLFLSLLLSFVLTGVYAQSLGDFKPNDDSFKPGKIDKGTKEMYIANFVINFEVYKEAIDKKREGGFGRTVKNASKAKAAVGLSTLDKESLQATADKLYADFVAEMKDKGYSLISAEEAGKTAYYEGWKKVTGPSIFEIGLPGILAVVPSGYSYYYKEQNAVSNKLAGFAKGSQDLSQELNDAVVADISLVYAFTEVSKGWNIEEAAKVKIDVNYRLAHIYHFSNEKTEEARGRITKYLDTSKQEATLSSYANFTRGKLKIGGSPESQYAGSLKSCLEINDVLKKEKIVAYSKQTRATATIQNPVVIIRGDNYSETTKWLEPDGIKYSEGMYNAGSKFLSYHTAEVFE